MWLFMSMRSGSRTYQLTCRSRNPFPSPNHQILQLRWCSLHIASNILSLPPRRSLGHPPPPSNRLASGELYNLELQSNCSLMAVLSIKTRFLETTNIAAAGGGRGGVTRFSPPMASLMPPWNHSFHCQPICAPECVPITTSSGGCRCFCFLLSGVSSTFQFWVGGAPKPSSNLYTLRL